MCSVCHQQPKISVFSEQEITHDTYLTMLENSLMSQSHGKDMVFQQDGAHPRFHHNVGVFLDRTLP
jgi:hypothetical protein